MDLKQFKNIHKNKNIFIAGAGPHLRMIDTDILKDEIVIAVNGAIAKFNNCQYYVTEDHTISEWDYYYEHILTSSCYKFFNKNKFNKEKMDNKAYEALSLMDNIVYFDQLIWEDEDKKIHPENVGLHSDPNKPLTASRTSTASAIHIAHIMGAKTIILLGCDCQNVDGKNHYWEFEGEVSVNRIRKEAWWEKHYMKTDNTSMNLHAKQQFVFWNLLSKRLDGAKIIDCSFGKLKMFDQIELEKIL